MGPPGDRKTTVCTNGSGHMIKMLAMSSYGKILKNLPQMDSDVECTLLICCLTSTVNIEGHVGTVS